MIISSVISRFIPSRAAVALSIIVPLATVISPMANADEADATRLLKSMSDYVGKQKAFSFDYNAILGIVTTDGQSLELASSGKLKLHRPDKLHASRSGGFVDTEVFFDGKTMTLLGKNANLYTQIDAPGTIDKLLNTLLTQYNIPLPAGDLLMTSSYDQLMDGVIDVKDLGSGVINGIECDYLAFRTEEVDWQIWIAQGDKPYPCRFAITSKLIEGQPQYSVQISNWKTHEIDPGWDFKFKNSTKADKVDLQDIQNAVLPQHFKQGDAE